MSQERLAELTEGSRGYISLLERGVNSATISMLFQLAAALDVTPSRMLAEVEVELRGEMTSVSALTRRSG
jgi:transcriptional regulator with XRE-family HTH domain